jgi:hypothetical protein
MLPPLSSGRRGRIVVLHFAGQMPLAGIAWQAMQYVLGFERLGFECWYVEDHGANPYDPAQNSVVMECDLNVATVKRMMERFGLGDRWAYWDAINDVYYGRSREEVRQLYRECDAVINLCGATRLREEHMAAPRRIMIDTDPVYEQIKYAGADAASRAYLDDHTHFFTYGENVGGPGWIVPLHGIAWKPTRPPVLLEEWPVAPGEPPCFSTIATWENKGKNIEFGGDTYVWSKHVNFLKFIDTPKRNQGCFKMAMLPPTEAVERQMTQNGWRLTDPRPVSATMESYAEFIRGSRGEFTVAKDIYVRPNSGWFSDRSVCYLASGRPVITMKTGFSRFYPAGEGLFEFSTEEEIAAAVEAIAGDYGRHAKAARRIVEEYFSTRAVLSALLADAGLAP